MPDFYCNQVLSGATPVQVEVETERVLAFHHTRPAWDIHIAIIPKAHIPRLTDVHDATLLAEMLTVAQQIIRNRAFNESSYKLITNGGSYQSAQHLHFHLVSGGPIDPDNLTQLGELRV